MPLTFAKDCMADYFRKTDYCGGVLRQGGWIRLNSENHETWRFIAKERGGVRGQVGVELLIGKFFAK